MVRQEWLEEDEITYKKQWIEDYIREIKELKQENAKLKEMIESGR